MIQNIDSTRMPLSAAVSFCDAGGCKSQPAERAPSQPPRDPKGRTIVLTCWHRFSVFLTIENVLTKNDCWVLTYLAAEVSGRVGVGVLAKGTPEMD